MPLRIDPWPSATVLASRSGGSAAAPLVVGLINNMPDAALEDTEGQFRGLLAAAAGPGEVRLRLSYLPEVPRVATARNALCERYWPLDDLLSSPLDALIVTGTAPRAPSLRDEPYWKRLVEVLTWAEEHTVSSVWSCLAAHAVVLHLDGIERRRLPEKLCGVFAHAVADHPLTAGLASPLATPQSRWNDLPPGALAAAGYTMLSQSPETGANAFVKHGRSLLVFFQGHPEYEDRTLLKEYHRDVRRFLAGELVRYPALPAGYFRAEALGPLRAFQAAAVADRNAVRIESFPYTAAATGLANRWRAAAVQLYANWLSLVAVGRRAAQFVKRNASALPG